MKKMMKDVFLKLMFNTQKIAIAFSMVYYFYLKNEH